MKKTLLIIYSLVLSSALFAQKIGQWDTHFSYEQDVEQLAQGDGVVYVLTDGKLYSYSQSDDNVETYAKKNGGNNDIKQIAYSTKHKVLIIVRDNADIDLLYSNGASTNIPDLKNTSQNVDKAVNSIYIDGDYAYLSTNFGILILNLDREEVKETVLFNTKFYDVCIYQDTIYAATENGVLRVDAKSNILDVNTWEAFTVSAKYPHGDYSFNDNEIRKVTLFKDKLHFFVPGKGLCYLDTPEVLEIMFKWQNPIKMDYSSNDKLLITRDGLFWNVNEINSFERVDVKGLKCIIPNGNKANQYWAGISKYGLSLIQTEGETHKLLLDSKKPQGPLSNYPFYMTHEAGQLLVTGGGYYLNTWNYPARLSQYENNRWFLYDRDDINAKAELNAGIMNDYGGARDFTSVITDPSDKNRKYVASWGEGIYEFQDGKFKIRYRPSNTNGILEDVTGGEDYVRLDGLKFDKYGNLWLANTGAKSPIKVLQKGGVWAQIYHSEIASKDISTQRLMIDKYNRKWIFGSGRQVHLFILDDNNTIANAADDKKIYVERFVDQDGSTLAVTDLNAVVEDKTGNIWVGTNTGTFVVYNSNNIFSRSVVFNKIKIPRTDGTNNADILLENVDVRAIAIDGANRKWFGTVSGLYLMSANGLETIHHFTMDNSPLPTNSIVSLAIDPKTGVVYVGTEKGVVSFVSEATEGNDEFTDVHAFPNPVRPGYEGVITITGLQANSNVKITDVRGNLLNQGESLGGQYVWNGRNGKGNRVDTGVYLVFASSADGKAGVVTKIMVVN